MNPLKSAWGTIICGLIIIAAIGLITDISLPATGARAAATVIWTHVAAGITWIGLLYYFNFVQVQSLAEAAADEGGPGGGGITKYVAPRALLWFRWAAVVTWLSGAFYLMVNSNLINAFTLGMNAGPNSSGSIYGLTIGIGAWMGTIMLFNVWILIWPNQKKVLGLVEATPEQIASAKSTALMASRTNTMLSLPMLASMVGAHHGFLM
ncbi:MAG: urate hydroxylase PuuD [Gammaproteobacteria bacterium]